MSEAEPVIETPADPAPPPAEPVAEPVAAEPTPTPEPTPEPPAAPKHWSEGYDMSENVRSAGVVQSSKDLNDMIVQAENSQKLIGKKGIIKPNPDDPADVARYYNELGRPEAVEKYDFGDFTPDAQYGWNDQVQGAVVEAMWKKGATNEQVKAGLEAYHNALPAMQQALREQADAINLGTMDDLNSKWGQQFSANISLAQQEAKARFGDQWEQFSTIPLMDGRTMGDLGFVLELLVDARKNDAEDTLLGGKTQGLPLGNTPAQAEAKLKLLQYDPEHQAAMTDAMHPEHALAVRKEQALYEAQYGTEPRGTMGSRPVVYDDM